MHFQVDLQSELCGYGQNSDEDVAGKSNEDAKVNAPLKVQNSSLCTSTRVASKQSVHLLPGR
jgi:hypothetical protein